MLTPDEIIAKKPNPMEALSRSGLMSQTRGELDALNQDYSSALAKSQETPSLTTNQALVQGVVSMLPMVIGYMLAGKEGLVPGSQSAATAAGVLGEGFLAGQKNDIAQAGAKLDVLKSQMKDKNDFLQQLQRDRFGAEDTEKTQDRIDQRAKLNRETQLEAARIGKPNPLETKVFEEQVDAQKAINLSMNVLQTLHNSKFDPKESLIDAVGRGIKAGIIKDSEAADLQRQIHQAAFAMLKPTFPGALSDEERKAMMSVVGGDLGVPVGTLKKIFARQIDLVQSNANGTRSIAESGGFRMSFPPIERPKLPGEGQSGGLTAEEQKRMDELLRKQAAGGLDK